MEPRNKWKWNLPFYVRVFFTVSIFSISVHGIIVVKHGVTGGQSNQLWFSRANSSSHWLHTFVLKLVVFCRLMTFVSPAGSICMSANDMIKYLTWVIQPTNSNPILPPKWVLRQAQGPSNVLETLPLYSPQCPGDYDLVTYGMGWWQGVYRGKGQRHISWAHFRAAQK